MQQRFLGRKDDELRQVFLGASFVKYAAGSCFVKFGDTHVICSATVDERVPMFLRNKGSGWVTAEYAMLPCSTKERVERESTKGRVSGRSQEIQRLIGRSLRAAVDLELLGERQIKIDCDVIQADGGTRTASITGAYIALQQAVARLLKRGQLKVNPMKNQIAAVSCGIVNGRHLLDLDYGEDSNADVDANFVMNQDLEIVEIQTTAEKNLFSKGDLDKLISLAESGIKKIIELQNSVTFS